MAEIIEARVFQKTDTLANWNLSTLVLGKGEQAFVISSVDSKIITFKIGDGTNIFSALPWPDFTVRGKLTPIASLTGLPAGVYIPVSAGVYGSVTVVLTDGYQILYWDGTTVVKVVYPIDLTGYPNANTVALKADKSQLPVGSLRNPFVDLTVMDVNTPMVAGEAVTSTGTLVANAAYSHSEMTFCGNYTSLIMGKAVNVVVAFYDTNRVFISYVNAAAESPGLVVPVPATAIYMIVNNRTSSPGVFYVKATGVGYIATVSTVYQPNSKKMILKSTLTDDVVVSTTYPNMVTGEVVTAGVTSVNAAYRRTDMVNISAYTSLKIANGQFRLVSFFDENRAYISEINSSTEVVDYIAAIPTNAVYGMFNHRIASPGTFSIKGTGAINKIDGQSIYIGDKKLSDYITANSGITPNPFAGKKYSVIGDSISAIPYTNDVSVTASTIWHGALAAALGMTLSVNNGVSGTPLAFTGTSPSTSFVARVNAGTINLSSTDYLFIEGGMNDLGGANTLLGTFDYTSDPSTQDLSKFIPGYRFIIEHIQAAYPNVKIVLCTVPMRTLAPQTTLFPWRNTVSGVNWVDINEAITQLGKVYHLPVLDMSRSATFFNNGTLTVDGVHPTLSGFTTMSKNLISQMKAYLSVV